MKNLKLTSSTEKVGGGILVIYCKGNILNELRHVSKSSKQISLQFKMSLNCLRRSISEL